MSNWKFLLASHYAGTKQRQILCEAIKRNVERLGLSKVLPQVKYQVWKDKNYYLGVLFDESVNDAFQNARTVLNYVGITNIIQEPQDPDKVNNLLTGDLDCLSFTIPLRFDAESKAENIGIDTILSLMDINELRPNDNYVPYTDNLDKLLYWCSSTGSGDLGRIQETCQLIGISTEYGGAWSVIRRFTLLGHSEFEMGNSLRWGIIPTAIIKTSADNSYYLSGQRSPSLIKNLRSKFKVTEKIQNDGPTQIVLEGLSDDFLVFGTNNHIRKLGCVSQELSNRLPSFEQWSKEIPKWDEKDFSRYIIEQYVTENNKWAEVNNYIEFQKGLYKFFLKSNDRKTETLAYYDDKDKAWICGDFYSLQFLARHKSKKCKAFFLNTNNELLIPFSDRWPMPFERALVLASGLLPSTIASNSGIRLLRYSNISIELANKLCDLLDIKMEGEQ